MVKKDYLIIYSVIGIPLIILIFYGLYTMFHGPNRKELMMKEDFEQYFSGRIDTFYFDERNHNGKYAVLNNHTTYPIIRPWERFIETGDSLSKNKSSYILEVYKKKQY